MKKSFLCLLAALYVTPASAYDFGTAGVTAALGVGGAALALTFGAPAAIGTVAIGAVVAGIELADPESSTTTDAIQAQLSPSAVLPTPAGWTPPASGSVEPTPPASTTSSYQWTAMGGAVSPTVAGACEASRVFGGYPRVCGVTANAPPSASVCSLERTAAAGGGCFNYSVYPSSACAPGYVSGGAGSCVLSNPSVVQKPSDNKCVIKRTGNSFAVDPRDPDCASGKIPASTAVQPNVITQTKPDGSTRSVTINGDGSSTISESKPNGTNNTTETNTTHIGAPDAASQVKVTGQASGSVSGTGSAAGTSPVSVFDKSGLATESTQAGIKADTAAIKDALTGEGVDSSLNAQKGALDGAMDSIAGMFAGESAKDSGIENNFSFDQYLPQSCGCTPLTIDYHGHSASFDWCAPMETIKGGLAWALGILTALFVLVQFRVGGGK